MYSIFWLHPVFSTYILDIETATFANPLNAELFIFYFKKALYN